MTYQWKVADSAEGAYQDIAGATGKTHKLAADKEGKFIKVEVQGTFDYTGTKLSAGIVLEDTLECNMIQIHYAAYLFRKRSSADTGMPCFLRYELNNLLMHQKGRKEVRP